MAKIGIFYGSTSGITEEIAMKVREKLGESLCDIYSMEEDFDEYSQFLEYEYLLFGCSTWGAGDVQNDWRDPVFEMELDKPDFSGKTIALFGAGDQVDHGTEFVSALGKLHKLFHGLGATLVGEFPNNGYSFEHSSALLNDKFVGLPIDEVNQSEKTEERITQWVESLRPIFVGSS